MFVALERFYSPPASVFLPSNTARKARLGGPWSGLHEACFRNGRGALIPPPDPWPALPYDQIAPTAKHIHRLVQLAVSIRLISRFTELGRHHALGNATRLCYAGLVVGTSYVPGAVRYPRRPDRRERSTGRTSLPLRAGTIEDAYASFVKAISKLGIPAPSNRLEPEIAAHLISIPISRGGPTIPQLPALFGG
ncbi:MAG: hypothetical protein DLM50_03645 [Candidatus Meridianibacter frigidus]|nr:MAG: hypothetical protein DLM50_03645 [Candidatus Eremiobacteraeota bacterium]